MILATWNCAMSFQKKVDRFLSLNSDVAVVQECSKKSMEELRKQGGFSTAWCGKNPNKGLGVIVRSPWTIESFEPLGPQWTALAKIAGPIPLNLVAVWACAVKVGRSYIGQVHETLDLLEPLKIKSPLVVAGDFNSNSIWDKKRKLNHSNAVDRLSKLGVKSVYHSVTGEMQGSETAKTLFLLRNSEPQRHYHIDYAFVSPDLMAKVESVSVGSYERWSGVGGASDHAPLIVTL